MQKKTAPSPAGTLDEFKLRDELKNLRAKIPDTPALNPILSVGFDLSRQLESGEVSYDEVSGLANRLMDRACVRRARRLRERIGYTDQAATIKEFTKALEQSVLSNLSPEQQFSAFQERWCRARTGIVLTAHPTFGLSDNMSKRIIEIAVADQPPGDTTLGVPHREHPDGL
jgi:phosphoenolpyruvate carboxylase